MTPPPAVMPSVPRRARGLAPARAAAVALLLGAAPARAQQPSPAASPDPHAGDWHGVLRTGVTSVRLTLALRRDSAGRLAGTFGSPDQTAAQLPATFAERADTLVVTVPAAGITYTGVRASPGDSLRGTFAQGGVTLPLAFGRPTRRPQDPVAPLPYRTVDVAFESAAGVRLAGTLAVPPGPGPFPAAVVVSGSGAQDRDGRMAGHRPYLVLADHLARRGVAVLRYDDRGVGGSTGDHGRATSADFADDAAAAVRYLRTRPEVARDRVGIVGHSEGGLVGPMVAARTRDVAFLVLLAGPGLRGDSVLVRQIAAMTQAAGVPEDQAMATSTTQRRLMAAVRDARDSADAAARFAAARDSLVAAGPPRARAALAAQYAQARRTLTSPWMRYFLAYDPAPALRRVRVPVLALNGTLDVQVDAAENLAAIGAALAAGGNRDHTETALPGLNHLFQTARTGLPGEYAVIDETVAPAALEAVAGWVAARFGPRRPARRAVTR